MRARFEIESIESVDVPESVGKIFKLTNVNLTPKPGDKVIEVPGKTFFVGAGYYIWHFLFDEIAAYVYVKKQNVNYLVDAQSVTEAEARTVQYLVSRGEGEFEVKSASEAKIAEVILLDSVEAE